MTIKSKTLALFVAASLVSGAAMATETTAPAANTTAPAASTEKTAAPAAATETATKAEGEKAKKKKKKNKKAEKATTSSSATVSANGTLVAANAKPSPATSDLNSIAPATPAATTTTTVAATAPAAAKKVSAAVSLNIGDSIANVKNNELKGALNSTLNFVQVGYKVQPKLSVAYRQLFTMNGNTEVAGVKKEQVFQADDGFVSATKVSGSFLGSMDNTINSLRVYLPISEKSKTKKVDTKLSYVGSATWGINSKLSANIAPLITMTYANKRAASLSAVAQATLGYDHSDTVSSYVAWIPQYSYALPESDLRKATMGGEAHIIELGASFAVSKNVELNPLLDIPFSGKLSTEGNTLQLAKEEDTWLGLVGTARF